jgi:hypothetical protein
MHRRIGAFTAIDELPDLRFFSPVAVAATIFPGYINNLSFNV